jgi:hypothetical protein
MLPFPCHVRGLG